MEGRLVCELDSARESTFDLKVHSLLEALTIESREANSGDWSTEVDVWNLLEYCCFRIQGTLSRLSTCIKTRDVDPGRPGTDGGRILTHIFSL